MAQVKAGLTAQEAAERAGVSIRQFRRMVAGGVIRPVGGSRPGVASSFDRQQVEQVAAGRDYAATLGRVAWNVQTGRIRSGFSTWFRHDARNDFRGALRVLDDTCPDKPPASFVQIARDFAKGFAPGALRYCIGVLFLHAYGPAMKQVRPMPPDARRFFRRISEAILGESLDGQESGIAKATRERQSALAVFFDNAHRGDFEGMIDVVRRYAPDLLEVEGEDFSIYGAGDFVRWHRRTYGPGRREVKAPKRAAVARLMPSPDNPRRTISRPVIARIACQLNNALRRSIPEKLCGSELFGPDLFIAMVKTKRLSGKRIVEVQAPDSDPWNIESFLDDEISRMNCAARPRRSTPPPDKPEPN